MCVGHSWLTTRSTSLKTKFKSFLQISRRVQHAASDQRCPSSVSQTFTLSLKSKFPQVVHGCSICQIRAPKPPGLRWNTRIVCNGINGEQNANATITALPVTEEFCHFHPSPQPQRFQVGPHRKNLICHVPNWAGNWGFS